MGSRDIVIYRYIDTDHALWIDINAMSTISKCAISLMRIWVENMLAQVGLQRSDLPYRDA